LALFPRAFEAGFTVTGEHLRDLVPIGILVIL
jgi:hypothetical protein